MKTLFARLHLLTICCLLLALVPAKAITIHFIDKGEEIHAMTAPDNQGSNVLLTSYFNSTTEANWKAENHLQSFNGFEFAGWRDVAPMNHEREYGVLNPTDEDGTKSKEHILTYLNIGTEDITLFAVYRRPVDCFRQVRLANAKAGNNYLIVGRSGGYGGSYYVMGNQNKKPTNQSKNKGANAESVETHVITRDNTYAFGSDDGGETTNTIRKIYTHTKNSSAPYYDQFVWKLVDDGSNLKWNNQGDASKWLRFYVKHQSYTASYPLVGSVTAEEFKGYADIIDNATNSSNFNISAADEVFTIGRDRTLDEWYDNFTGLGTSDTEIQKETRDFIEGLPYDDITAVGHSKGGNKAMYSAIVSDKVSRAVSMDGQGFSQEFMHKYEEEIRKNASKITNYSLDADFVHILLYQVPGSRQVYIDGNDYVNKAKNHSPINLFYFVLFYYNNFWFLF